MDVIAWLLILFCVPVLLWMVGNIIKWNRQDKAWLACFSDTPMTDEEWKDQLIGAAYDERTLKKVSNRKIKESK